jgi:hypothetical protein
VDPEESVEERTYADLCPHCGRPFGFPIQRPPASIRDPKSGGEYVITSALARGFYGATYIATGPPFGAEAVLKVIPTALYAYFGKNFEEECKLHYEVAQGNEHIVDILTFFDADVTFDDNTSLPCHIAVLKKIDGPRLDRIIDGSVPIEMHTVAQIAIDLLRILAEFDRRNLYHNDLQSHNIVVHRLGPGERRFDEVDDTVRTVAIDLGSVSPSERGQDPRSGHLSDLRSISRHLHGLAERMLQTPEEAPDLVVRVAQALEDHAIALSPSPTDHRLSTFDELADVIRRSVERVTAPWKQALSLRKLSHYDNAQQLEGWQIPQLLEDPDGEWVRTISEPGPTLIKGMRGCGKTMLLRALELHARLKPGVAADTEAALRQITADGFMGLYFPGLRLMDKPGLPTQVVQRPYERLFVGYALQALRAIHHLSDVAPSHAIGAWHQRIGEAVSVQLSGASPAIAAARNPFELERELVMLQVDLGRDEQQFTLSTSPSEAFPYLAEAIRGCSTITANFSVLFLLDDVSTRYLEEASISDLFSSLLFQSPVCSFKLTTEGVRIIPPVAREGRTGDGRARPQHVRPRRGRVLKVVRKRAQRPALY